MTNVGWATLDVIPSLSGFQSRIDRGINPVMTSAGKRAGSRFGSAFKGTLGALGVFQLGSSALRFLGDSVEEGREAVKVGAQTRAVIKSTGGVAKVTEKQVGRLAGQYSRLAGVDDEIVQGGANILLTFKNIRNETGENNKIFDKANLAALNLSTALGKDLNSSALMVGKALNDPVAGLTALGRAGVQFSADQKAAIKDFVATGDTLSAQKIILKELNEQFRGSAKAQRTEADRLSVAWGDFKEEIGTALIPILDDLARFMRKEGIPKAKEFFGVVRDDGIPALKKVAGFAKDAGGKVKDLVGAFRDMPDWVQKVLIGGAIGGVAAKKLGVGKLIGGDNGLFTRGNSPARPLFVRVTNPGVGTGTGVDADGKPTTAGPKGIGLLGIAAALAPPDAFQDVLNEPELGDIEANTKAYHRQQDAIEEIRREWALSKDKANDYNMFVRNKLPGEIKFTVLGWPVAQQQARDYLATLLEIRAVHQENRLEFGPSGSAPTSSGGGGGGKGGGGVQAAGRGVVVNNTYNVNTTRDAVKYGEHKGRQVAAGGFGD